METVPSIVWVAILERMKIELVQQNVKIAALDNIKMHLATTLVWIVKWGSTWVVKVPSIVWVATRVIFKTWPEQNRAKNVWKIRSPTSVECRLVILVKLAKEAILEVPNAPIVTPVNLVRVTMALVKHARKVNLVNPMSILLILVLSVNLAIIKRTWAKRLVYPAYLERMKTTPVQPNVKSAALGNIKIHLATTPVWSAMSVNTWIVWAPSIVWIATRVIIKTRPEQNRAKIVLQIPLQTSVGFPRVILVVVAPKQKKAVQSVPVATRVNLVLAPVARVNNALLVNRGRSMM
jgi:hypothetical protein